MEFLTNLFGLVALLVLVAVVLGAVVGIVWLWVRFRGWMFLIFGVNLAVSISLPSDAPSGLETATMAILFVMFWTCALAGFVLVFGDVQSFGKKLTKNQSSNLHEHGDLGWHDHPYEGNHRHYGNHMSGPFYYVDERVIDQR